MSLVITDPRLMRSYMDIQILWMMDPHRYRATLWGRNGNSTHHTVHLATLWSKDIEKLKTRVYDWIDVYITQIHLKDYEDIKKEYIQMVAAAFRIPSSSLDL